MPKVSVIVPVYGVEKYIERCARSLFEQTLSDIEYIFIDDCTPDNSIHILQKTIEDYPQRQNSIRIERMPHNSGLPAVRKFGVELAVGDYLIACDSDDWVEKSMYEEMYNVAISKDFDIVMCDIDVVNSEGAIKSLTSCNYPLNSTQVKKGIINGTLSNSLCNKLVKRSIYQSKDIVFPQYGMDEDNVTSIQLAFFSTKLAYIKKSFYCAFLNTSSMSRILGEENILKKYEESLANAKLVVDFLLAHGYSIDSKAVRRIKYRPKYVLTPLLHQKKYLSLWAATFPEINFFLVFGKGRSFLSRLKAASILLRIYPMMSKWY